VHSLARVVILDAARRPFLLVVRDWPNSTPDAGPGKSIIEYALTNPVTHGTLTGDRPEVPRTGLQRVAKPRPKNLCFTGRWVANLLDPHN
jgi:hypothetical protein